ncbi:sugar ABC transporter ATPase [Trinickia sp. Y13]|uniref:sugar ABC transporter ATPase n=1 Tax=Trinickia sp. Y13 TaxID=2917807 RepID=UPI002405DDD7|nr:sugar ABC transporter ATPase [Trinickia sp. Y13]MDG0027066.1 sugar ABC transporter ATPase [Trinickia sp. Y13]
MKRFPLSTAALALAALLTACGSTPQDSADARDASAPMAFSSSHSPRAIANCLTSRLSDVHRRAGAGYTELGVGRSASGYAWLITLAPSAAGSNVRVEQARPDDSVSEPELRFAIARCTT